jgi:hypothetical protein
MSRALKLERYGPRRPNFWSDKAVRSRVVVADAFGMPAEIFVYERRPPNETTGEVENLFQSVASPTDLTLFPVDNPDPDLEDQFFRLSFIELDLACAEEFDKFWTALQAHVCGLIDALEADDRMIVPDEFQCGDPAA